MTTPTLKLYPSAPLENNNDLEQRLEKKLNSEDVGIQQRDRQDSQDLNNDNFYRLPVTSAQCIIRTEKKSDAGTSLNYEDDDSS